MNEDEGLTVNEFLYGLQKSGAINMFGAAPLVQLFFGLESRDEAAKQLADWMRTWDEDEAEAATQKAMPDFKLLVLLMR